MSLSPVCLTLLLAVLVHGATHDVHVGPSGALTFSPADLTVSVGDTVHFIFDTPVHTVTHGTGCNPEPSATSLFDFPSSDSVTFSQAGSVPYFCRFHCSMGMVGHITVKTAASNSATGTNTASAGPTPSSTGSSGPTGLPSFSASGLPTFSLSGLPSIPPTSIPSFTATGPSIPTATGSGIEVPTSTGGQSISVTALPTVTFLPTGLPSGLPSSLPSGLPSGIPTGFPTGLPSGLPTGLPTGSGIGTGVFNPNDTVVPPIPEIPSLYCRDIRYLTLFQEQHQALVTLYNHTLASLNASDVRPCDPVNSTRVRGLLEQMRDDNAEFLSKFRSLANVTCAREFSPEVRADCLAEVPCSLSLSNATSNTTDLDTLLILLADLTDRVSALYRENYLVSTSSFLSSSLPQTTARVGAVLERQSAVLRLVGGDRAFPSDSLGKPLQASRTSIRCQLLRYFEPASCCDLYGQLICPS